MRECENKCFIFVQILKFILSFGYLMMIDLLLYFFYLTKKRFELGKRFSE